MWAAEPKDFLLFLQQLRQRAQVQEHNLIVCPHCPGGTGHRVGGAEALDLPPGRKGGSLNGSPWDCQPQVILLRSTGQSSSADAYECRSPMVPVPPVLTSAQEAPAPPVPTPA